jgi:hypothetical protein
MPRAWRAAAAIVLLGGGGGACHHHAHTASSAQVLTDSLVGIVSVTGTSFEQRLVLRTGNIARTLAASSADSAALSRLGGAEIVVHGARGDGAFRVATFEVQRVDGAPVADGTVARDGGRLALETTHGRLALGNPPAALESLIGARIWIAGPLDLGPNSFGVIAPPSASSPR